MNPETKFDLEAARIRRAKELWTDKLWSGLGIVVALGSVVAITVLALATPSKPQRSGNDPSTSIADLVKVQSDLAKLKDEFRELNLSYRTHNADLAGQVKIVKQAAESLDATAQRLASTPSGGGTSGGSTGDATGGTTGRLDNGRSNQRGPGR